MDSTRIMATGTGLGALALHYIREDAQRQAAFHTWMDRRDGTPFPSDLPFGETLRCAEAVCAGLHDVMGAA